jgi:hypothetical protein
MTLVVNPQSVNRSIGPRAIGSQSDGLHRDIT